VNSPLTVSLPEFLDTGGFGPLRPGASRRQIASACGRPSEIGTRWRRNRAGYWFYGSIEIGFAEASETVSYVQIENVGRRDRFEASGRIALRSRGFVPWGCDVASFRRFARAHGIGMIEISPPWSDPEVKCLATRAGVVAWFGKDPETGETWFQTLITEDVSRFVGRAPVGFFRNVPPGRRNTRTAPRLRRQAARAGASI
jgi:hypothetical protein